MSYRIKNHLFEQLWGGTDFRITTGPRKPLGKPLSYPHVGVHIQHSSFNIADFQTHTLTKGSEVRLVWSDWANEEQLTTVT